MKQSPEKIAAIAERDRCWAELRERKDNNAALMHFSQKEDKGPVDFLLFFQCISMVLADITLYEEDFLNIDKHMKQIIEDRSAAGCMIRSLREAGHWQEMVDKKLSNEKRLEAVDKFRKSIWASMVVKKDTIIKLAQDYPELESDEQIHLMMQCVAIVGLEIELREKEIELFY